MYLVSFPGGRGSYSEGKAALQHWTFTEELLCAAYIFRTETRQR